MRMRSVNTTEMEMAASTFCLSIGVELFVSNPVIDLHQHQDNFLIMGPKFCLYKYTRSLASTVFSCMHASLSYHSKWHSYHSRWQL